MICIVTSQVVSFGLPSLSVAFRFPLTVHFSGPKVLRLDLSIVIDAALAAVSPAVSAKPFLTSAMARSNKG